ncbi:hypothetical protein B0H16DRAFT_1487433 [Mycena metata]|uniref:Uncharacterized protein n=1 Tax=Mycena metata TaxID=1033252 RepID=A0AAD7DBZ7_9AGAR|nr:hypothetical protein B0H16DRAFT_1487433 [Mycena metata]
MSSVPLTQTSDLLAKLHMILPPALGRRMEPSLDSLWVSQIHNLCQGMHKSIGGRIFTEFPSALQKEMCTGLKILLSNIILIGPTKVSVESDPSNPLQYYVPSFGALIFAMIEQFVMLCGFEGDEDAPSRESMFWCLVLAPTSPPTVLLKSVFQRIPSQHLALGASRDKEWCFCVRRPIPGVALSGRADSRVN